MTSACVLPNRLAFTVLAKPPLDKGTVRNIVTKQVTLRAADK